MIQDKVRRMYTVGTSLAFILGALWVVFLLITAIGKPAYSPGALLAVVLIGLIIPTAGSAVLQFLEHRTGEAE